MGASGDNSGSTSQTLTEDYDADSSASTVILGNSPARSSTPEQETTEKQIPADKMGNSYYEVKFDV